MKKKCLNFGIIGCAGIAMKQIIALKKSKFCKLVAIASRDAQKVKEYAKKNKLDTEVKLYSDYDSIIEDTNVQCIYIPLPSGLKKPWVKKAIKAKKHVIAEKPFLSEKEVVEIMELAKENGVHFMDNCMFVHHLRTKTIVKEHLQEEKPIRVNSIFNFYNGDKKNIRFNKSLEPLGALGDLGYYCIRSILLMYNYQVPAKVSCTKKLDEDGVIVAFSGELYFENPQATGYFSCSFEECTFQELTLIFKEKVRIFFVCFNYKVVRVPEFVIPLSSDVANFMNFVPGRKKIPYSEKTSYYVKKNLYEYKKIDVKECYQVDDLIDTFCREVLENSYSDWGSEIRAVSKVIDMLMEK